MGDQKDRNQVKFPFTEQQGYAWFERVKKRLLETDEGHPPITPSFLLIAAQPGAGKSRLISKLKNEFKQKAEIFAHSDIDEIRIRHPRINDIMASSPFEMAVITNQPAHDMRTRLLDAAKYIPANVLYEATINEVTWLGGLMQEYREDGYGLEVHALAVPNRWSVLGIFERFERAVAENSPENPPRMVGLNYHNGVYPQLTVNLKTLIDERTPDLGRIYDPNLNTIWTYEGNTARLVETIEQERARLRTPNEIKEFEKRWDNTLSMFQGRKPLVGQPENYASELVQSFIDARDFVKETKLIHEQCQKPRYPSRKL